MKKTLKEILSKYLDDKPQKIFDAKKALKSAKDSMSQAEGEFESIMQVQKKLSDIYVDLLEKSK